MATATINDYFYSSPIIINARYCSVLSRGGGGDLASRKLIIPINWFYFI